MYGNSLFNPEFEKLRKPPTDPASLGVNIGKPFIPSMNKPTQQTFNTPSVGLDRVIGGLSGAFDIYQGSRQMANQSLGLTPDVPQQYDLNSQPIYNLGQDYNEAFFSNPQGATGGEVGSMALKGASAGSVFGPIGAGAGAIIGGAAALIGGRRRKKKQQKEKANAQAALTAGQQSFNQASREATQRQNAQEDYLERLNPVNRMYNLYAR